MVLVFRITLSNQRPERVVMIRFLSMGEFGSTQFEEVWFTATEILNGYEVVTEGSDEDDGPDFESESDIPSDIEYEIASLSGDTMPPTPDEVVPSDYTSGEIIELQVQDEPREYEFVGAAPDPGGPAEIEGDDGSYLLWPSGEMENI